MVITESYGGHDWQRKYNAEHHPLLMMECATCGKIWYPDMTVRQLGRCRPES